MIIALRICLGLGSIWCSDVGVRRGEADFAGRLGVVLTLVFKFQKVTGLTIKFLAYGGQCFKPNAAHLA